MRIGMGVGERGRISVAVRGVQEGRVDNQNEGKDKKWGGECVRTVGWSSE